MLVISLVGNNCVVCIYVYSKTPLRRNLPKTETCVRRKICRSRQHCTHTKNDLHTTGSCLTRKFCLKEVLLNINYFEHVEHMCIRFKMRVLPMHECVLRPESHLYGRGVHLRCHDVAEGRRFRLGRAVRFVIRTVDDRRATELRRRLIIGRRRH